MRERIIAVIRRILVAFKRRKIGGVPLGIIGLQFCNDAKAFIEAAEVLRQAGQGGSPIYFLYSHALELALKGFLSSKGVDPEPLGHDIQKAFKKAIRLGLNVDHQHAPAIVRVISRFHVAMLFRYPANKQREALYIKRTVLRTDQLAECVIAVWRTVEPHAIRARLKAASVGGKYDVEEWFMGGKS